MKQYCRYCSELNIAYGQGMRYLCNEKMKYVRINTPNKCRDYKYCGLNEYGEEHIPREYSQRKEKINDGEQMQIGKRMKTWKELHNEETGEYITNERYKEIIKLHNMLDNSKIPHEFIKFMDGYQVNYYDKDGVRIADAIEHFGSYGHEQDLLEIMGLLTPDEKEYDSVVGWLTAEDVFDRIKNDWGKQ